MIQVATYSGEEVKYNLEEIEQYSLHDIRSLDEYEINVIDLGDPLLWQYEGTGCRSINDISDFVSISSMICGSTLSKIIIFLPQNLDYLYHWDGVRERYRYKNNLKDMLDHLTLDILPKLYPKFADLVLSYENTTSYIGNKSYEAAFCFRNIDHAIIKSQRSNKSTVIKMGEIILSTLKINDGNDLLALLNEIGLLGSKEDVPAWMNEIKMFDDMIQETKIVDCEGKIEELQQEISISKNSLNSNMRLKSALYTNGDELVGVVFEILEEMLGCDLSHFIDEKKEDFLFEINNTIFIGEIKGVNHNVKSQNVTQLDVHYQSYLDEHEDVNEDSVKALLIINHQKNKPIPEREPIKDMQVNLAERNGSLIIETYTLLKLLEKYRTGALTREQILIMLKETKGMLFI